MPKLCQIIAIEDGAKKREYADLSTKYKVLQKPDLFNGFVSTYKPINEDGDTQPDQRKVIQHDVNDILAGMKKDLSEFWNIVATKDVGNCQAKANIIVDGNVVAENIPVTHLLFLEKQLNDLRAFIGKLPTLDPSKDWEYDETKGVYKTSHPETRIKTRKVHKPIVKIPPGPHSKGDAELVTVDEREGVWTQVDFSSAYPVDKVRKMLDKVNKLQAAVKFAREEANSIEVEKAKVAESIINFVID